MTITPLSTTTALVDSHWRRDKKDGTLFNEGSEIMAVLKTPAGWKIAGILVVSSINTEGLLTFVGNAPATPAARSPLRCSSQVLDPAFH